MEEKGKVCATDRMGYSIILGIMVLFLGLSVWVGFAESVRHGVTGGVAVLIGMAYCLWKLIDLRYLDAEGITCTRFGKTHRFLAWKDVASVHRVRRYEVSMKTSGTRVLLVTPVGVPPMNRGKAAAVIWPTVRVRPSCWTIPKRTGRILKRSGEGSPNNEQKHRLEPVLFAYLCQRMV